MEKVEIKLTSDKIIRGKKYKAGTVLMTGEVAKKIECTDVDKAIQLGQAVCCVSKKEENKPAKGKGGKKEENRPQGGSGGDGGNADDKKE